jgi:alcohol dehydrogenase (cytochrome c)
MYVVDSLGIVSKIDVRSGTAGQIVWQMNPKQEKQDRNRGVALWNNLVISQTGFAADVIASDKDTGKVAWETNLLEQADLELTAAPLWQQLLAGFLQPPYRPPLHPATRRLR